MSGGYDPFANASAPGPTPPGGGAGEAGGGRPPVPAPYSTPDEAPPAYTPYDLSASDSQQASGSRPPQPPQDTKQAEAAGQAQGYTPAPQGSLYPAFHTPSYPQQPGPYPSWAPAPTEAYAPPQPHTPLAPQGSYMAPTAPFGQPGTAPPPPPRPMQAPTLGPPQPPRPPTSPTASDPLPPMDGVPWSLNNLPPLAFIAGPTPTGLFQPSPTFQNEKAVLTTELNTFRVQCNNEYTQDNNDNNTSFTVAIAKIKAMDTLNKGAHMVSNLLGKEGAAKRQQQKHEREVQLANEDRIALTRYYRHRARLYHRIEFHEKQVTERLQAMEVTDMRRAEVAETEALEKRQRQEREKLRKKVEGKKGGWFSKKEKAEVDGRQREEELKARHLQEGSELAAKQQRRREAMAQAHAQALAQLAQFYAAQRVAPVPVVPRQN